MFPEPKELLLIGCSIESVWTPRSKSNTLTPQTNLQTCWPRETSHVINWIIFCVCLTLAISVLQSVLKWFRKEHKKIQVKKESQQNRNQLWIWSRDAAKGLLSCYLLLHQKARWKPDTKVKLLWVLTLRRMMERGDPLWTHSTRTDSLLKTMRRIPFLHRVNDQVRKRKNNPQKMQQKTATNNILYCEECLSLRHWKRLFSWRKLLRQLAFHKKQKITQWI